MDNESCKLKVNGTPIYIAGIQDIVTGYPNLEKALQNTKQPVILLSHQPDIFPSVSSNVFLTLSGHTHGGQVNIPGIGPVIRPSKYGYQVGNYKKDGKELIVTQGVGTSVLPFRFNCAPEIVVIDFY